MPIKRKKTILKKKERLIFKSKPSFGYYLLIAIPPIIFFIIAYIGKLFSIPVNSTWVEYLSVTMILFVFLGIPLILIVKKRVVYLYKSKVIITRPVLRKQKTLYFKELVSWKLTDQYMPKVGRQVLLTLTFKSQKIHFNKVEIKEFNRLVKKFERDYPHIKE